MLGRALGDDFAASVAGFGADVDEVVGLGHDVGVVLDDDDGVAVIDEAVEDVDEFGGVFHVEADSGFFDQIETVRCGAAFEFCGVGSADAAGELGDEFDALGFTAGQGG